MALKNAKVSNPGSYKAVKNTARYQSPTFNSMYGAQVGNALGRLTNWSYDPMKDASYQALTKVYNQRGNTAAKNVMGQAAMLNGGYNSSYATTAAAQQRSIYNQELAALAPEYEERAYGRARDTLSALRDAEESEYSRFRDTVGDAQWQYAQDYQNWRDQTADKQWQYSTKQSNYQFAKNYNLDLYAAKKSKSSGGGGGGSRGRSGGGGYGGSYGGSSSAGGSGSGTNPYSGNKGTKNDPGAGNVSQKEKEYQEKMRKKNLSYLY